jgi:hypothetical protein
LFQTLEAWLNPKEVDFSNRLKFEKFGYVEKFCVFMKNDIMRICSSFELKKNKQDLYSTIFKDQNHIRNIRSYKENET